MIERFWAHPPRGSLRFALAAGAVAIATPVVALLHALLPESSLAVAYLPAVIAVAVLAGRAPALLAAALAFLAYDFLFVVPYFTMSVSDPQEWANLVVFLATGIATAQLAGVARARALEAKRNEYDAMTQFRLTQALTDSDTGRGMRAAAGILADETGTPAVAIRLGHSTEVGVGPTALLAQMGLPDVVRDAVLLGRPDDAQPTGRWVRPRRQSLGRRSKQETERFARVRVPTDAAEEGWIVLGPVHDGLGDPRAQRLLVIAAALIGTAGCRHLVGVTQVGNGSAAVASESASADEAAVLRARVEHLTQQSNTLTAERDALVKRVADLEARPAVVAAPRTAVVTAGARAMGSMNISTPALESSGEYSILRFAYRASAGPTAGASTVTASALAAAVTPGATGTPVRFFTNRYNCTSFTSQAEAQEALAANAPGDPNRMDMNANGVACEDIAYPPTAPRNLTPISNR